ncbi:MAG TPA: cyclophilin-like fold protein [Deltaproteobacteria bacterium]|nr:cyclophilin-like fold protein [Deltaproteobacteria bacterium]HPR54993.1 cyclophilin-like fold protein [Deltaproteobacteria bacterium]HXK46330.1 cyclophilin-like fold protein [Deltaproteobacteria bacterium]
MQEILITAGHIYVRAVLSNSPTAREIGKVLPIHGITQTWGEEVYFTIPIRAELEPDARQDIEVGELGYWPTGPAFCIFFGPTPASTGGKPRAYSPVNIIGRVSGDPSVLKDVPEGAVVVVQAVEEHP